MRVIFKQLSLAVAASVLLGLSLSDHGYAMMPAGFGVQLKDQMSDLRLVEVKNTKGPRVHRRFCRENPSHCLAGQVETINFNLRQHDQVVELNRAVNAQIKPRQESKDIWSVNVLAGDCEDYALTKRAKLIRLGFAPGALRIALTRTPRGIGHAVLVIRSTDGDLVLDNRTDRIFRFNESDLRFVAMSGSDPMQWTYVK